MHLRQPGADSRFHRRPIRRHRDEVDIDAIVMQHHLDVVDRILLVNAVEDGDAVNGVASAKKDDVVDPSPTAANRATWPCGWRSGERIVSPTRYRISGR